MKHFRLYRILMLTATFLLTMKPVQSQPAGKLISLHPWIGAKLDARERNKLALFPGVRGFQSAQFVRLPGGDVQLLIQRKEASLVETDMVLIKAQTFREKFQEPLWQMFGDSSSTVAMKFPQLLRIDPQQGAPFQGFPAQIGADSVLAFRPAKLGYDRRIVVLRDIDRATIIRSSKVSIKYVLLGSVLAGGVGAVIGFISGDDPSGWFSMTASEKAVLLGGTLGLTTMSSLLIYKWITGSDVLVALNSKTPAEKRRFFQLLRNHQYTPPKRFECSLQPGILFDSEERRPMWLAGLTYHFVPKVGMEFFYGTTPWSAVTTRRWQTEYSEGQRAEKSRVILGGFNLIVSGDPYRRFWPYLSVGVAFLGKRETWFRAKSRYFIQAENSWRIEEYADRNEEEFGGFTFTLGAKYRLNRWIRLSAAGSLLPVAGAAPSLRGGFSIVLPPLEN